MDFLFTISPTAYLVSVISVLLIATLYLFWDEHQLRRTLQHLKPEHRIAYLLRRFRYRNIGLLLVLTAGSCSMLLMLEMFRQEQGLIADTSTPVEVVEIQDPHALPDPTAIHAAPTDKPKKAAKSIQKPPKKVEIAAKEEKHAANEPTTSVILDLFTSDAELASDNSLDAIKKRYENALTGAYVLLNCQRTDKKELGALLGALRDDIVEYQSQTGDSDLNPNELYNKIVSAAEGSYQMIYAKTSCESQDVAMLEQQYVGFVTRYKAKQEALKREAKKARVKPERESKKHAAPSGATP